MINSREVAFSALMEIVEEKRFSGIVLSELFEKNVMDKRDRAFVSRVCMGTLERMITIDFILNHFSKMKVEKLKKPIRTILRMSVYQIFYMDFVPDSAVCNEAVKLAKKKGLTGLSGYVNGTLREIVRNKDIVTEDSFYPDKDMMPAEFISAFYSLPLFISKRFVDYYGIERAEKIALGLIRNPLLTIRVNTLYICKDELKRMFEDNGISVTDAPYVENALEVSEYDLVTSLPGFSEGLFFVQDVSSMLSVKLLNLKKGENVLDICAAPGGKTTAAAEILCKLGEGRVDSRDISKEKTDRIEENVKRLRLDNVSVKVFDATVFDGEIEDKYDAVICDVPCSGLGIMAKKPEIRYNVTEQSLSELKKLQLQIIDNAVRYVKHGGRLVYSTCTINEDENMKNAEYVINKYGFKPVNIKELLPKELKERVIDDNMIQLLPGVDKCDGFFIAVFERE